MARIICTVSGVVYNVHPAPPSLQWPHPSIAYGLDFPKPRTQMEYMLALGAALYHLSQSGVVRIGIPLNPIHFSPVWLATALPIIQEFAAHIRGLGSDRLARYPQLMLSASTHSQNVERWLDECDCLRTEYEQLSTTERDKANEAHRVLVHARARATQLDPVQRLSFTKYLERTAIDCALDDEARYSFFRVCKNPSGCSDRAITSVLNQIQDWAPQETIDDQLNFDSLVQRLTDALLDSRTKTEVKAAQLNAELAKGLFRERAIAPASVFKQKAQAKVSNALADMLAKIGTMKG